MSHKFFYHYFSGVTDEKGINYSLKSLQDGKISFAHIRYFNDPCEFSFSPDENTRGKSNFDMRYEYELQLRLFCFSETFQNPLMWGHYGNSHQGFCVGYDQDDILGIPEYQICFGKVHYSDDIPCLPEEDINNGLALFYKSSDWEKENEWRASICLNFSDQYKISKTEFIGAREDWLKENPFFERAVDSHLRLPLSIRPTDSAARDKISKIRKSNNNFEIGGYAYSPLKEKATGKIVYAKFPMRVEGSLKAKIIYIGIKTPDEVRIALKEYAKLNGIDIYEMGIEQGTYSFFPKKIIL